MRLKKSCPDAGGARKGWEQSILSRNTVQRTPAHLKNCSYFKMLGVSCQETKLVLSFLCFIPFFFFKKHSAKALVV